MKTKATATKPAAGVDDFLATLEHPLKPEILALRSLILGVDARIAEAIKWNAPSFYTSEHFATMHLRANAGLQLILHFGAKKRDTSDVAIDDPDGLLTWLGTDRATLTFTNESDITAKRAALEALLRQWITYL